MVERFTAILEPFARLTSATAEDLGRMAPKADAASELLQRLAPLTNACMLLRRAAELSMAFDLYSKPPEELLAWLAKRSALTAPLGRVGP